jgi:hypothetical protein
MRGTYFFVLISCLFLIGVGVTGANFHLPGTPLRRLKAGFKSSTSGLSEIDWHPFDDAEVDDIIDLVEQILPGRSALATTLCGLAMLCSGAGANAESQIHLMTMMRATGFNKERSWVQGGKRERSPSCSWRAPSFAMAARSVHHMQDRVHFQFLKKLEQLRLTVSSLLVKQRSCHESKRRRFVICREK